MKGATAEPDVKTIKLPRSTRHKIIGKSQNFFRSFMKDQSSNKNSPIVNTSWLLKADRNHKEHKGHIEKPFCVLCVLCG